MPTDAPDLSYLLQLQLFRNSLSNFLQWRNFEEVVKGCYVRVLLEMRSGESCDQYYIARVKRVCDGPEYSGFASDGTVTRKHLVIELPPCFRNTKNANVLELNSISNTPFRQTEYINWVRMAREVQQPFPSVPQLQFRIGMLKENKEQAMLQESQRQSFDPAMMANAEQFILSHNICLPRFEHLAEKSMDELQEIERSVLDLISHVRLCINERTKCLICRSRVCSEVCYPCKHQVLCKDCAATIQGKCPVPDCVIPVAMVFEPFSS